MSLDELALPPIPSGLQQTDFRHETISATRP